MFQGIDSDAPVFFRISDIVRNSGEKRSAGLLPAVSEDRPPDTVHQILCDTVSGMVCLDSFYKHLSSAQKRPGVSPDLSDADGGYDGFHSAVGGFPDKTESQAMGNA